MMLRIRVDEKEYRNDSLGVSSKQHLFEEVHLPAKCPKLILTTLELRF